MLYKISGEVIDHSELLDGEIQIILEGSFTWKENTYKVTNSLESQMGSDITISINHSELLIENSFITSQTIVGNYSKGTLSEDEETGELQFDLAYDNDNSSSEEKIYCEISVQGNEWSGFLDISESYLA